VLTDVAARYATLVLGACMLLLLKMVLCAFGMEYLLNVFDLLLEHMDPQKVLVQFSPKMRRKRATSMSEVLFPQEKIQSLFGLKNREKDIYCMFDSR